MLEPVTVSKPMSLDFYESSFIAVKGKMEKIPYSRTGYILILRVLSGDVSLNSFELRRVLLKKALPFPKGAC